MKPHPRIRKTVKWGGLALSLLLAGVWVRSEFVKDVYGWRAGMVWWSLGGVGGIHWERDSEPLGYVAVQVNAKRTHSWWYSVKSLGEPMGWRFSLWMPLTPTLLATAAAWRLDALARRRARAGLCPKCRYDRAGLAAGAKCPECGCLPAEPAAHAQHGL